MSAWFRDWTVSNNVSHEVSHRAEVCLNEAAANTAVHTSDNATWIEIGVKAMPDGVLITQFNGAAAGQSVFHLHFHIIPRWADARLSGHGQTKMADAAELEALAEKIAAAL